MKGLNSRFYKLVRLWITKRIKQSDFVEMAEWIGFRQEAIHLSYHQLTDREFNRTVGEAFFSAVRGKED